MRKRVLAMGLVAQTQLGLASPTDTYFSFAVTENSNKHGGDNLLYLDFQRERDVSSVSAKTVISPKVPATDITLDGSLTDWHPDQFSKIQTRVMNNYPLDEFYDVVSTDVQLASAYDEKYIYFAIRYTDANHDASVNRNRWVKQNGQWAQFARTLPNAGAPAVGSINSSGNITGEEDEDRVFFMFPIIDSQGNFRDGSHGCGGYCHGNLVESGDPKNTRTGQGVAQMHTNAPADIADVWQWTAARTAPAKTLRDGFIAVDGHKTDHGRPAYRLNKIRRPEGPAYVSRTDYDNGSYDQGAFSSAFLKESDLMPITQATSIDDGVSLPYYINRPPASGRGDVEVASRFDSSTNQWVIELKRRLDTGRADEDRIFTDGQPATPPVYPPVALGVPEEGKRLFKEKNCFACHGDKGEGKFSDGQWQFPRVQRASGALIVKTASPNRPKRLAALSFKTADGVARQRALMPTIDLTPQEAEHIAAWLQTQYTPFEK